MLLIEFKVSNEAGEKWNSMIEEVNAIWHYYNLFIWKAFNKLSGF